MTKFEIRYRMPPHGVGSEVKSFEDEFDAEIYAEETHGDLLISVTPYRRRRDGESDSQSQDWNVRSIPDRTTW